MTTKHAEDIRDALVAIFERYDGLTDEYDELCNQLRFTIGEEWSDPDKNCTPLEHALYCLCDRLGFNGRELYREARGNRKKGVHTSFTKWVWKSKVWRSKDE